MDQQREWQKTALELHLIVIQHHSALVQTKNNSLWGCRNRGVTKDSKLASVFKSLLTVHAESRYGRSYGFIHTLCTSNQTNPEQLPGLLGCYLIEQQGICFSAHLLHETRRS
jgi:hypothetical protein